MSIFDNLKTIFTANFNFSKLKSIHLFSDNKNEQKFTINNNQKTININIGSINADDLPKLQEVLKKAVKEDDNLLIEDNANAVVQDFKKVESKSDNVDLVDFFKGKIRATDLEILRASLYIKAVHERGDTVGKLKDDLVVKHGQRGRNISNLCTAGYFTSVLKPLYHDMVNQSDFTPLRYQETFDTIVDQYPFAIFVSIQMTKDQLLETVTKKMDINKKYGINYLNIHGIGEQNILKIEYVLIELKDKFTEPPDITSEKRYKTVTIYF